MQGYSRFRFSVLLIAIFLCSCSDTEKKQVIDVTAKDFSFQMENDIPSGWSTFNFINSGHAPHFFLLHKLPDSVSFERYQEDVSKPFEMVLDSLNAGMTKDKGIQLLISSIPPYYATSIKQMGGTGIIDPMMSEQVTLKLEPGNYVMECYIKEKGVFHTELGMTRPVTVNSEISEMQPPEPNINITLSNYKYEIEGQVEQGSNTIAVHFKEHPEQGLGNDIHLIKINDSSDIEKAIDWLDWMNIKGLEPPAPVKFLGGVQEMPVGNTAYFTVDIEPGHYAWIAESSAAKGMIKEFTVE